MLRPEREDEGVDLNRNYVEVEGIDRNVPSPPIEEMCSYCWDRRCPNRKKRDNYSRNFFDWNFMNCKNLTAQRYTQLINGCEWLRENHRIYTEEECNHFKARKYAHKRRSASNDSAGSKPSQEGSIDLRGLDELVARHAPNQFAEENGKFSAAVWHDSYVAGALLTKWEQVRFVVIHRMHREYMTVCTHGDKAYLAYRSKNKQHHLVIGVHNMKCNKWTWKMVEVPLYGLFAAFVTDGNYVVFVNSSKEAAFCIVKIDPVSDEITLLDAATSENPLDYQIVRQSDGNYLHVKSSNGDVQFRLDGVDQFRLKDRDVNRFGYIGNKTMQGCVQGEYVYHSLIRTKIIQRTPLHATPFEAAQAVGRTNRINLEKSPAMLADDQNVYTITYEYRPTSSFLSARSAQFVDVFCPATGVCRLYSPIGRRLASNTSTAWNKKNTGTRHSGHELPTLEKCRETVGKKYSKCAGTPGCRPSTSLAALDALVAELAPQHLASQGAKFLSREGCNGEVQAGVVLTKWRLVRYVPILYDLPALRTTFHGDRAYVIHNEGIQLKLDAYDWLTRTWTEVLGIDALKGLQVPTSIRCNGRTLLMFNKGRVRNFKIGSEQDPKDWFWTGFVDPESADFNTKSTGKLELNEDYFYYEFHDGVREAELPMSSSSQAENPALEHVDPKNFEHFLFLKNAWSENGCIIGQHVYFVGKGGVHDYILRTSTTHCTKMIVGQPVGRIRHNNLLLAATDDDGTDVIYIFGSEEDDLGPYARISATSIEVFHVATGTSRLYSPTV